MSCNVYKCTRIIDVAIRKFNVASKVSRTFVYFMWYTASQEFFVNQLISSIKIYFLKKQIDELLLFLMPIKHNYTSVINQFH